MKPIRQLLTVLLALMLASPAFATANIAPGYLSNNARTQGEMKTAFEQEVLFAGEQLGGAVETTLTISGGAVTVPTNSGNLFSIDTSGGAANLDNIVATNVPDGRLVFIRCKNPGSNPVTVRHNQAGSLPILMSDATNFVFASTKEWLLLKRTGSNFEEVGRFYGDQTGALRTALGLGTAATANTGTGGSNVPTNTQAATLYAALAGSTSQAFNVAGSPTGNNAVNATVAAATYAALAGLNTQTFNVATPTASNHAANKAYVDGKVLPFASTAQTLGSAAAFSLPHSLGAKPSQIWWTLVNVTTEGGYVTGDEVSIVGTFSSAGPASEGFNLWADATNVNAIQCNNALLALNKTTGVAFNITNAKWTLKLYARL